jgi:hypothetical protein
MVTAIGARGTLLASGLATVVLALVTAAALVTRRARLAARRQHPVSRGTARLQLAFMLGG